MKTLGLPLQPATIDDLYDITLQSAKAKSKLLYLYEKSDMSALIGLQKAEELRKVFLKNKIIVKQLTNIPILPKFTQNDEFIDACMLFRYVPKSEYLIKNEMVIFDDTVGIYNMKPTPKLLVIKDKNFAENQKQLFLSLYEQCQPPAFGFKYSPNHSLYNSIDFHIHGKQVIVYPDRDAVTSYKGFSYQHLEKFLQNVMKKDESFFKNAGYIIAFIWNLDNAPMIDMWKFVENNVDDRSGPLSEVRVYRNGEKVDNLEIASGNTHLVLGYEEKLRRQSSSLKAYLEGPVPKLPMEILNGQDFFEALKES